MRVFVTGASGLIGGAVARHLLAAGHAVTALARSDEAAERVARGGAAVHRGDLQDADALVAAARAADAVVHVAVGGPRGVTEADAVVLEVIVGALAGRDAPMLVTTGLGVYAGHAAALVDEETPLDTPVPAQAARVALEGRVRAAAARGVRAVVLRPAHVYGQGQAGLFTRMQLEYAARAGAAAYVGDGTVPYGSVHVDDLAAAYLAALERAPAGALYNVVGSTLPTREVATAVSHAVGAGGRTVSLTPEEAHEAWGPPAGLLARGPTVMGVKAAVELAWTPRGPSLAYELTHGSLRRTG
jgi:nucleoside-diphosphate-sugar epimerase